MRIVIVEDSPLLRDNLVRLLADHPELCVVGSAAGEDEACALIEAQRAFYRMLDDVTLEQLVCDNHHLQQAFSAPGCHSRHAASA